MTAGARHRYPGPPPFEDTPEDRLVFFGRDAEIASVSQLVIASRLVVVFGKSGLGKTSLLNAGIFPRLRHEAFLPAVVRIQPGVAPVPLVVSALQDAAKRYATDCTLPDVASLWELFKTAAIWRKQTLLTPLLVFDQFEEVFTFFDREAREALADELGALVSGSMPEAVRLRQRALPESQRLPDSPPHVRVVIAMREEYLAALEDLSPSIPQVFQNRVRLLPLSDTQATKAIREPASLLRTVETDAGRSIEFASEAFEYDESALKVILQFLHGRSKHIEPWELQLVCMHVEQHVVPKVREARAARSGPILITAADLGGADAMRRVLSTFYETTIGQLPGAQGRRARELCDTGLVSPQGRRLPLERDQINSDWKVTDETLDQLVDSRLVRRESRLDSTFYEISHDTLAETILLRRRLRLPRRLRIAAWVFGFMACCGLGIWVWAYSSVVSEKRRTDRARVQSEQLVAFLIGEDLLEKLGRSGQMTMLEVVQQRVKSYLDQIPTGTSTLGSRTAEEFARLNEGDLAFLTGRMQDANAAFRTAVENLRVLHAESGHDAVIQGGLARALERAAEVAGDQGRLPDALALRTKALKLREDLVSRNPADDSLGRRLANAHVGLAEVLRRQGKPSEASGHAEHAMRIVQGAQGGSGPEWDYVAVEVWDLTGSLASQKLDYGAAEAAYTKQRDIAKRLRDTLPFEAKAHYAFGLATYQLANLNAAALRDDVGNNKDATDTNSAGLDKTAAGTRRESAMRLQEIQADVYRELYETIAAMTRWEPRNRDWVRELAASGMWVGWSAFELGRKDDAIRQYKSGLDAFEKLSASNPSTARRTDVAWAHEWLAEVVSDDRDVRQHLDAAVAIHSDLMRVDPTDRDRLYDLVRLELSRARLDGGDALKALDRATALLEAIPSVDRNDGVYFDLLNDVHQTRSDQLATTNVRASVQAARRAVEATDKAIAGGLRNHFFLQSRGNALRRLASRQRAADDVKGAAASNQEAVVALREATEAARQADSATSWNDVFLAMYEEVKTRQETGNPEGAVRASREMTDSVEKAVALDPGSALYRSNQGAAYRLIGDGHRTSKPPDLARAEGAYTKAETAIRKALSLENAAETWNDLFLLFHRSIAPLRTQQGQRGQVLEAYQRALDAAQHAVAAAPKNGVYRSDLGLAHREVGDTLRTGQAADLNGAEAAYAKAEEAIRAAVSLENSGENWNALYLLLSDSVAPLRAQQRQPEAALDTRRQAIDALNRAVALTPSSPIYRSNLHYAHRAIGDVLAAGSKPDNAGAIAAYKQSLAAITSAVSLSPKSADYLLSLCQTHGKIATKLGELGSASQAEARAAYGRAVDACRRATELDPQSARAWDLFAYAQFDRANSFDKSRETNEGLAGFAAGIRAEDRAIALDPKVADYHSSLAQANYLMALFLEARDLTQAADKYERSIAAAAGAVAIEPDDIDVRAALGDRYFSAADFYERKKKDLAKAGASYQAAVPLTRDRAMRPSASADDQLMYVDSILGAERANKMPATSAQRAEVVSILKRLSEESKLPADLVPVLKRMTGQ